jgi:hypothetical protein
VLHSGENCTQESSLPWVPRSAWHSGKANTRGRPSSPRATLGEEGHTKKKVVFNDVEGQHHFKKKFPRAFPECLNIALREASLFPECSSLAIWEGSLPRYDEALGEPIFLFGFFAPFFCEAFLNYLKVFAQIWSNFKFFSYISLVFCFVEFFHTSNLNYRCMKWYNLAFQKMIFLTFGVYWGCIQELTWNASILLPWHDEQLTGKVFLNYRKSGRSVKITKLAGTSCYHM